MKKILIPLQCAIFKSLDISISLFIVTPIIVSNWASIWTIFETLNSNDVRAEVKIISFVAGVCGQFALLFYQDVLAKIFKSNGIILVFMSRVLLVISNIVNVCFWREIWISYDSIGDVDDNSIVMNIIQNSLILMALRGFSNSLAAPFVIITETEINLFEGKTFLQKSVSG